ncbi:hypothetical protein FO519_005182 [Halicephalobus sp. NKZ332]|nr:hypothetical protein FO519_005182 [Halicephalobus sp. NKZ332]
MGGISVSTNHKTTVEKVEDDIASEPDIIQYRHYEFLNSAERKDSKPKAEEKIVETELAQELATEARQPISVVKELENELNGRDQIITVPVVEAHEDSNPVLNEDSQAFGTHSVVKSLGNLQDVADSLINDSIEDSIDRNLFPKTTAIETKDEEE